MHSIIYWQQTTKQKKHSTMITRYVTKVSFIPVGKQSPVDQWKWPADQLLWRTDQHRRWPLAWRRSTVQWTVEVVARRAISAAVWWLDGSVTMNWPPDQARQHIILTILIINKFRFNSHKEKTTQSHLGLLLSSNSLPKYLIGWLIGYAGTCSRPTTLPNLN